MIRVHEPHELEAVRAQQQDDRTHTRIYTKAPQYIERIPTENDATRVAMQPPRRSNHPIAFYPTEAVPVVAPPPETDAGSAHRMETWIRQRGDTEELYFADEAGLIVQLSHADYCGGSGRNGDRCDRPDPAPEGRIRLDDLNHFTVFGADGAAANRYYQETFGLTVQAYQGPQSPVTGIGDGRQFVMYAGGGGRGGGAAGATIHHGSFNMRDFDVERVRATLTDYGLTARDDGAQAGPQVHYVSLRMPNRGGAEGGTPELYFTDPDGNVVAVSRPVGDE